MSAHQVVHPVVIVPGQFRSEGTGFQGRNADLGREDDLLVDALDIVGGDAVFHVPAALLQFGDPAAQPVGLGVVDPCVPRRGFVEFVVELRFPDVIRFLDLPGPIVSELSVEVIDLVEEVAIAKMGIHVDDLHEVRLSPSVQFRPRAG